MATKKRKRPAKQTELPADAIEMFARDVLGTPADRAVKARAAELGLTEDELRQIVEKKS